MASERTARDCIAEAVKYAQDKRGYPVADAVLAALAADGFLVGRAVTNNKEFIGAPHLALIRVEGAE